MSFADDVRRLKEKVDRRGRDIHNGSADLALSSIVEGSPITGAPGQLVDTGNLKGSWQNLIDGPLQRSIVTNVVYARQMEDGTRAGRALVQRSPTGGFHSVKLTIMGWKRIVEFVTRKVVSNA